MGRESHLFLQSIHRNVANHRRPAVDKPNPLDDSPTATMHSALVRGQNVFGFFTTVVSFVAGFIALSVLVTPPSPSATVALRNVQMYVSPRTTWTEMDTDQDNRAKGRPHYYSTRREEYAHIRFNLDMGAPSP
jgi:hypothetical protein